MRVPRLSASFAGDPVRFPEPGFAVLGLRFLGLRPPDLPEAQIIDEWPVLQAQCAFPRSKLN